MTPKTNAMTYGATDHATIATLTGLEYLRGIMEGRYGGPTIGRTLGFHLCAVEEGACTFTGMPHDGVLNPMGVVHGGFAATLLDSAMACAVQTTCPAGFASTSIDLKVNFVRPILPTTGRLFARGLVVHPGRQVATAEGRLEGEDGKLYAHGSQACSVFRLVAG